jgi:hypothetical protein
VLLGCGHPPPGREASSTTLVLQVKDAATGAPLGARVLLFGHDGAAIHIGNIDLYGKRQATAACKIAPGVVGSWDGLILAAGEAEVPIGADACVPSPAIPYGHYKVWAWRGVEYERWEGEVELAAGLGKVTLAIPLERAWTPHGTLAADLHVHAAASNDSTVPNVQRVIAQVAAGVQVIGLSDHNANGDLDAEIHELGLDATVASIASNELTADTLHLGVYPVPYTRGAPHGGGPDPKTIVGGSVAQLFKVAHDFPGHPIIQVNHPRFRVYSLFDTTGWDGVKWPPPFPLTFDAVETLSGHTAFNMPGDRRIDDSVRDLYTFTDHGVLVAPLGNSDTHHLNGVHDALTRSYVFVDDARVAKFDEAAFVDAIRRRRVECTGGPWLDVEVSRAQGQTPTVGPGQALAAEGGAVWLDVTVSQTRFVHADHLRIMVGSPAGPKLIATIPVAPDQRTTRWQGRVEVGAVDTWLGVDAGGETFLPIEQTGTYQIEKGRKGVTPFALIAPILIDGDGDGRWKRGEADRPVR